MSRDAYIRAIEARLGTGRLLWWGTRGTDATALLSLEQFAGCFSLISPLGTRARDGFVESCLEAISGRRPDLNAYTIDDDRSDAACQLRHELSQAWRAGTSLAPYRPCDFLSATYFPRREMSDYLGMFFGRQVTFEHKPWVETALRNAGVKTIDWQYYANDDVDLIDEASYQGPRVLRANHSDGGIGVILLAEGERAKDHLPKHGDLFVAVAPLLEPNIPLNVSGCVFPNGTVTVHSPSLQLIGIPLCTARRFGYCGNDFARVAELLDREALNALERMMQDVGAWLHRNGYLGAFGIDALYFDDDIYLTEVNPRFQGSTEASTLLDRGLDLPDVVLEHVAAFLGLEPPAGLPSMGEVAHAQAEPGHRLSHVVCHNTARPQRLMSGAIVADLDRGAILGVPSDAVLVEDEGMFFKLAWPDTVTDLGFALTAGVAAALAEQRNALYAETR